MRHIKRKMNKAKVALGAMAASATVAMAEPVDAFGQTGLDVSTREVVAIGGILIVGSLVIWGVRRALSITGR